MTSPGWFRLRLGCAAASAGVFAFAVVVIGSLTPGYDQWSDAVSRLAAPGERWALAARAAFAAYGLLVVTGASTLRGYAGRRGPALVGCLTLYGVVCVIAGVAPKDQPGAAHTAVSQVHVAAAVLAGALAIGAMTLVSRYGLTPASRRVAVAMTLCTVLAAGIFRFTWGTRVYGISERVLLGLGMCWISALAVSLYARVTFCLRAGSENRTQRKVEGEDDGKDRGCGATGRVGRPVVDVLAEGGHEVVAISRSNGIDVITGDGLAAALDGADAIIDTATSPSPEQGPATEFFTTAARNLHEAGSRAGVRRLVVVSIMGTDRFTGGYGAAKVAHEQAALAGPIQAQILRAAQFYELVDVLMSWSRQDGTVYLPKMRTQAVAARAVAEALVAQVFAPEPAAGAPIPEIAGPREEYLPDMAALLAGRRGDPVKIEAVDNPADPDDALNANGGLLPSPHATLAGPTFTEWLDATL